MLRSARISDSSQTTSSETYTSSLVRTSLSPSWVWLQAGGLAGRQVSHWYEENWVSGDLRAVRFDMVSQTCVLEELRKQSRNLHDSLIVGDRGMSTPQSWRGSCHP